MSTSHPKTPSPVLYQDAGLMIAEKGGTLSEPQGKLAMYYIQNDTLH